MAALDAISLAEKLSCLQKEDYWLHLEAESPLEKYPAKQHARRVREKLGVGEGLVYLPGEPARSNEDSDMPAPFRQRRYFYYLSGCNEPNCHLTYDIQHDILALFIPRINPERVIWNGRGSTPAEALDKYDIDEVYFIDELQSWIQAWYMHYIGSLYILHPSQAPQVPFFSPRLDSTSLQPAMNLSRMIKDDHEIKLIRKANDISSQAHKEVLASILKFRNEAQVEGLFLDVCISKQAKQQAYDPIAASGPNAGTLHYDANNEDFEDRQLICLDAGCEYELYASDITRTFPLSGAWPTIESENIYKLVQRMQETCIERLKPGVRYLDLHILAHQIAIDGLLQLGILHNGTREEIYKAGTSRAFFPHGLGHHVGLEVHDVGQKELMSVVGKGGRFEKALSLYPENFHLPVYDEQMCRAPTDPHSAHLEEGMVVTVEPGIYFSTYALSYFYLPSPVHSKYINFNVVGRYLPVGGVRIEDDILITSKGHENLTTAPKGDAMLEIIRSGNAQWPFVKEPEELRPRRRTSVERKREEEEMLLRAPGVPERLIDPEVRPVQRAATAPVQRSKDRRSADFEPFEGPSLFSNFRRSMTADEALERQRAATHRAPPSKPTHASRVPICGEDSPNFTHVYMGFETLARNLPKEAGSAKDRMPACKECTILSQAMGRLRQTLELSEKASPKLESKAATRIEPVATKKSPEMRQVHQPARNTTQDTFGMCGVPSYAPLEKPASSSFGTHRSLERELRNKAKAASITCRPEVPQRRSATFDSYLQQPNASMSNQRVPASNPYRRSVAPAPADARTYDDPRPKQATVTPPADVIRRYEEDRFKRASASQPLTTRTYPDQRPQPPPASQAVETRAYADSRPPQPLDSRSYDNPRSRPGAAPRPQPAASRGLSAAYARERPQPSTRPLGSRASLPVLRPHRTGLPPTLGRHSTANPFPAPAARTHHACGAPPALDPRVEEQKKARLEALLQTSVAPRSNPYLRARAVPQRQTQDVDHLSTAMAGLLTVDREDEAAALDAPGGRLRAELGEEWRERVERYADRPLPRGRYGA